MDEFLLTAEQMRAWETGVMATGVVTGLELMERAGRGAVEAILAEWSDFARAPGRATVLCGPGNNGGDGFVVARLLRDRGWRVDVFLYGDPDKLPPDARRNHDRWGGPIHNAARFREEESEGSDLAIDALFGTGLARAIDDPILWERLWSLEDATHATTRPGGPTVPRTVALDIPSGLDSDTGHVLGGQPDHGVRCPEVALTVTFGAPKPGHYLADGPRQCGKLVTVDIGLGSYDDPQRDEEQAARRDRLRGTCRRVGPPSPSLDKGWHGSESHKYDFGHALVLTGGMGRTGAARLAARAALRVGAGLVTLGAPGAAMMECAAQITALMLRRCEDAAELTELLRDDRISALCLGPGLGTDGRAADLVAEALASGRPAVLDADALTLIGGDTTLRGALHDRCVLTPHGGEFARLFPDIAERLAISARGGDPCSKVDATRDAARQTGCTILFKGPDTVIADPSGIAEINAAAYNRAAPWLATAGTGDVLAGLVAGLLVQRRDPMMAACSAAWLHVEAARAFGPGLIAEDLSETLPEVLAGLSRGQWNE